MALLLGNLTVPGLTLALSQIATVLVGELVMLAPTPRLIHARPAAVEMPLCVEPVVQTARASAQRSKNMTPEPIEPAESARDGRCKYCGMGGLTAIEVARHGRARAQRSVPMNELLIFLAGGAPGRLAGVAVGLNAAVRMERDRDIARAQERAEADSRLFGCSAALRNASARTLATTRLAPIVWIGARLCLGGKQNLVSI